MKDVILYEEVQKMNEDKELVQDGDTYSLGILEHCDVEDDLYLH